MKKKIQHIKIHVDSLSTQGEGIGRTTADQTPTPGQKKGGGQVVFVPRALPGEAWVVEIHERHKNFMRGKGVERQSSAAPDRREPPCPHYETCGGCQLQHLAYSDQLRLKREWLRETFRRVGHLDVDVPETIAGDEFGYRNRMAFDLGVEDGCIRTQMHDPWNVGEKAAVEECPLLEPELNERLVRLRDALNTIVEKNTKTIVRGHRRSRLRVRRIGEGFYGLIENFSLRNDQKKRFIEAFSEAGFDGIYEVTARKPPAQPRVRPYMESQEPLFQDEGAIVTLSPLAFLQVNGIVAEKLYAYQAALPVTEAPAVLDLYAGTGILARRLERRFRTVIGVDRDTVTDRILNEDDAIPEGLTLVQAEVEPALPAFLERLGCDVPVFLNPPRTGLSERVLQILCRSRPVDLVITSCHPAALARDAAALCEAGYEVASVQPFDLFPQTYHLEAVLHLRRCEASVSLDAGADGDEGLC